MPNYWTLSGTLENWVVGLVEGVWGAGERARALWEKVQSGDVVVFYAVKVGVLGYGVVEYKFTSDELLWPDEVRERKAIWPYRLRIRVVRVFDQPRPRLRKMPVAFAINKLDEGAFREVAGE